jgi:hypothetical protein
MFPPGEKIRPADEKALKNALATDIPDSPDVEIAPTYDYEGPVEFDEKRDLKSGCHRTA